MLLTACIIAINVLGAAPAGQIAFLSGARQPDLCVCVIDIESMAATRVGPGKSDGAPVWSPDGAWLAFETQLPDGVGIYVVRPDGTDGKLLKNGGKWNHGPRWSPDGTKVAYAAEENDEPAHSHIVVYDIATETETRWGGDTTAELVRPVWLPSVRLLYALKPDQQIQWGNAQSNMTKLAYLQTGSAMMALSTSAGEEKTKEKTEKEKQAKAPEAFAKLATNICIVTAEMTTPLPVLPSRAGRYAEWGVELSPQGDKVAFESNDGGDREIFVLSKKGVVDVTNHRASDWNPAWSPDGNWIAFESFRDGRRGIYRTYAETARILPIAVSPDADNWWPSWAPTNKWVAFVSTRGGHPQVFVTDLAGKSVVPLTSGAEDALAPAWRPKMKVKK
jgi:Tol biopolymer transport system component